MSIPQTAFTQENMLALEEAIVEGVRRVKYTDKEVEYRSLDEMLRIYDLIRKRLGCAPKTIRVGASFSKGLC